MISVCMATFNGEKYVKEQIDSILIQLSIEDELVISDDGSTDRTLKIIESINDSRIKVYKNTSKQGYSHNFENAIKKASGDYIFLSDQDDVWLSNKVGSMLPYLKEDNLVMSDAYITDENLIIKDRMKTWRKYKKGYFQNLYKNIYAGCTCAFTKNIKNKCLPFPHSEYVKHDNWIGLISELQFNVIYIDEALIYHRRHSSNHSSMTGKSTRSIFYKIMSRLILLVETLKRVKKI